MTATENDTLESCPGVDHVRWLLDQLAPGRSWDPASAKTHCLLDNPERAGFVGPLTSRAQDAGGIVDVAGWRPVRLGATLLHVSGADGRSYDLAVGFDPLSGLLTGFALVRPLGSLDGFESDATAVTPAERTEVRHLFERAYTDANLDHVESQFEKMTNLARMYDGDRLIGFSFGRQQQLPLPVLGPTNLSQGGTTCVDPDYQRSGFATAATTVRDVAVSARPYVPHPLAVFHFATPVTAHAALQYLKNRTNPWPGKDVHDMVRAYASPSPTQRAVGRYLAEDAGAADYDEDHWVMIGNGHGPGGASIPEGLDPAYLHLFQHVDRDRGDTLLGPFWKSDPPPAWFA